MSQPYPDLIDDLNRAIRNLRGASPTAMQAFSTLAGAALAPGQLDVRTKELIAVAIAVAVRCDGCVGFHVKAAIRAGARREELAETVAMAIYMGAGPSMIYGAEALRAFDELAAETNTAGKDAAP
jgi:AhpD family alkylhydroperoxidase